MHNAKLCCVLPNGYGRGYDRAGCYSITPKKIYDQNMCLLLENNNVVKSRITITESIKQEKNK